MRNKRSSYTAEKIAKGMPLLRLDRDCAALLPPSTIELSERLCDESGIRSPSEKRANQSRLFLALSKRLIEWTAKGICLHLALRKRYVHDQVLASMTAGAEQVVNIGAGFDVLALSLARRFPNVSFIEIDHPNTSGLKQKGALKMPESVANLKFFGVDLAKEGVKNALDQVHFAKEKRAVFIAEGLLPYLDEEAVRRFFLSIQESSPLGSKVIATYAFTDDNGRILLGSHPKFVLWMLKLIGEPFRFAKSPREMAAFVQRLGFKVVDHPNEHELVQRYLGRSGGYQAVERFMTLESV